MFQNIVQPLLASLTHSHARLHQGLSNERLDIIEYKSDPKEQIRPIKKGSLDVIFCFIHAIKDLAILISIRKTGNILDQISPHQVLLPMKLNFIKE